MSGRRIALIVTAVVVVVVLVLILALPHTPLGFSIGRLVIGSGEVIADEHDLEGFSKVTINMNGTLNVELWGASQLQYTGDVDLGTVNVSGASTMSELPEHTFL